MTLQNNFCYLMSLYALNAIVAIFSILIGDILQFFGMHLVILGYSKKIPKKYYHRKTWQNGLLIILVSFLMYIETFSFVSLSNFSMFSYFIPFFFYLENTTNHSFNSKNYQCYQYIWTFFFVGASISSPKSYLAEFPDINQIWGKQELRYYSFAFVVLYILLFILSFFIFEIWGLFCGHSFSGLIIMTKWIQCCFYTRKASDCLTIIVFSIIFIIFSISYIYSLSKITKIRKSAFGYGMFFFWPCLLIFLFECIISPNSLPNNLTFLACLVGVTILFMNQTAKTLPFIIRKKKSELDPLATVIADNTGLIA